MANISAIKLPDGYTYTIVDNTSGWTDNKGTVTSVRVQASSPVQSSVSTEQNTSLNTTISLADGYGDAKNPYASKTKNYVLAAPSNANGTPSFRALVAADIPDLSETYLTSYTETDPVFLASAAHGITASDITNWNNKTSNTGTVKKVTAGVGLNTTSNDTATDGGDITTTGTLYLTKSGVTAGSYGDSGNQTPNYGNTFKVPYITVDKYGRVTAITEHTVKIPASDNTNTTYSLSNALASHTFTETLTAGGSGSGTSTATMEFAAGTGISLQDDTTNKKLTIGNTGVTSITTAAGSHSTKSSATGAVSFNVPTKTSHLTNDSDYTTKTYVDTTIANLPEPMIFKGSLGTDGTITTLPAAASTNEGYTYKVISDGTYASQTAKIGDTFISDGSNWILIPSGDEPSGTVTSVKVQGSNGLTGSGTVTSSGTITISHATGTGTSSSNSGRTYIQSVTLDSYGHVTGLTTATETVTNTTYSLTQDSTDGHKITLTPSSGTAQTITIPDTNTWRGIQDNLNSTSATDSLSANQGKILNESKLSLTGGNVTGPVTFGDSVEIDEATIGDLIVNGNGNFTNNLQVNTINGVAVGSNPKFTDTLMTVTTTGNGNAVTAVSASGSVITVTKGATYSNNAGTVTKVTAGTGLSIGTTAQGEFTTSGTINHTNSVTAQTTQAIYPIKIDAQGHISAYGNAVTPLTASSTLDATKLSGTIPSSCYTDNDTKNTAGSNDTSSKIFLVGTTSQTTGSNALQTYSQDTAYVGTDGCLYSDGKKVLTSHQSLSGYVPTSRTIDGKALSGNITLHTSKTATLSTSWSSKQQTVSVTGVTTSNTVIVSPAPASYNDYCGCGIYCSAQAADSLTFKCEDVPSAELTVNILIIGQEVKS